MYQAEAKRYQLPRFRDVAAPKILDADVDDGSGDQRLYYPTRNMREVECRRRQCDRVRDRKRSNDTQRGEKTSRHDQQTEKKEQMVVASQNVFHTEGKEIRKRADGFQRGHTRVGRGVICTVARSADALSNRSKIVSPREFCTWRY